MRANILPQSVTGSHFDLTYSISKYLRLTIRVDRVYRIQYRGKPHIFHLEFQASSDEEMAYRLLAYHAGLWRDYRQPVISMIVYLFRSSIVDLPLREIGEHGEILTFHFLVLALWTLDARQYVQEHAISMYTLLPRDEKCAR